jgi:hypothetical protein
MSSPATRQLVTKILRGRESVARLRAGTTVQFSTNDIAIIAADLDSDRRQAAATQRALSERAMRAYIKSAVHALHRMQRQDETASQYSGGGGDD